MIATDLSTLLLPDTSLRPFPLRIDTGDDLDVKRTFRIAPRISPPIWEFRRESRLLRLQRPLLVRIWSEELFVFAENVTLNICGTGGTQDEAVDDFGVHAFYFYDYYRSLPVQSAMGEALRLKREFESLFVEE